ncbi:hypothetical protein D3C71_592840 [compost metagenome]
MIANARNQFDIVRQFDQIIVGPGRERRALDQRVFLGRQDDDRNVLGRRVIAVFAHQAQAIETGHDQILQDHRWLDAHRMGNGLVRVGAEMEVDVFFVRQPAPHRLADHRLIVDQQHHGGIFVSLEVVEL